MTTVEHLLNISKFLEKIQSPVVAELQMHYVRCCREFGNEVELPKKIFGPGVLCPRCGSAWATTKHKTRISPRRLPPRRIENLIRMFRGTGSKLSKYYQTLVGKCERNRTNKIIKICTVCSAKAKFPLSKPERRKIPKLPSTSGLKLSSKKKKKRTKDKTAGLNLPGVNGPETKQTTDSPLDKDRIPLLLTNNKKSRCKSNAPTPKLQPPKINVSKLKSLMNTNVAHSKKSKLHAFLHEL